MTHIKKIKCNGSIDLENDNDINTIYHLVSEICYCRRNHTERHVLKCHSQLCQANNQHPDSWWLLQQILIFAHFVCTSLGLSLQDLGGGGGSSARQYVFLVVERKPKTQKLAMPYVSIWTGPHLIAGNGQGCVIPHPGNSDY